MNRNPKRLGHDNRQGVLSLMDVLVEEGGKDAGLEDTWLSCEQGVGGVTLILNYQRRWLM